ncbi:MAG: RsmE family RNA methyltransferase [Zavarzinella sp.]
MAKRFFSTTPTDSEMVVLDGTEAHHALHVMRLNVGDQITLFDGCGKDFLAEIVNCQRKTVILKILSELPTVREISPSLSIAVALPKGDRGEILVEKLTELGVTSLIPIVTQRSITKVDDAKIAKLQRIVVESSKQCGRSNLMKICSTVQFQDIFEQFSPDQTVLFHQSGQKMLLSQYCNIAKQLCLIGPEGGWSPEELEMTDSKGVSILSFSNTVLRTETAAIAAATLLVSSRHTNSGSVGEN